MTKGDNPLAQRDVVRGAVNGVHVYTFISFTKWSRWAEQPPPRRRRRGSRDINLHPGLNETRFSARGKRITMRASSLGLCVTCVLNGQYGSVFFFHGRHTIVVRSTVYIVISFFFFNQSCSTRRNCYVTVQLLAHWPRSLFLSLSLSSTCWWRSPGGVCVCVLALLPSASFSWIPSSVRWGSQVDTSLSPHTQKRWRTSAGLSQSSA